MASVAAVEEPPVQAFRPAIGLLKLGETVPLYPPETKLPPPARTSTQLAPPSLLTSTTPPSNPSSKLNRCQKLSWLVLDRFCGGATRRSSLRSSVVESLWKEWVRL